MGFEYRTTLGAMGSRYLLPLSAEYRAAAGVCAGDPVEVNIEVDLQQREIIVPSDIAASLAQDNAALTFFNQLANSHPEGAGALGRGRTEVRDAHRAHHQIGDPRYVVGSERTTQISDRAVINDSPAAVPASCIRPTAAAWSGEGR